MINKMISYWLDLSKLTFGGIVIAAVLRQDFTDKQLLLLGSSAVVLTASVSFAFAYFKKKSNKRKADKKKKSNKKK